MGTVLGDPVDVHLRGADHEIHMVEAGIAAGRVELLLGQLLAAGQGEAIGAPNGDMTGGILIKQCVVEEVPAPGDGRAGGHKGNLAKPAGAFIRIDQFLEDGLILFGMDLDDPAILKGYTEIFDQSCRHS